MNVMNASHALNQPTPSVIRLPRLRKRLLILGTGQQAKELGHVLVAKWDSRYKVIGFLDRDPTRVGERLVNPGIIGTYEQLFEIVEHHDIRAIAICLDDRRSGLPMETLLDFKSAGVEVVEGQQLFEQESGRLSIDLLKPSALIFSSGFQRRAIAMGFKRLIDLLMSTAGLLALAPLFALVGTLIKLESAGPMFYRQMRVGLRGKPYMMWKLRSMRCDAEEGGAHWAAVGDTRITRVGRWLRKWRIDELPQLINVVKGEMSIVGPRPERPVFVQELRSKIPYYDLRHTVRPGITGWAQVRFRYAASPEDAHVKLQYDMYYLKNLSLALDLRILLETIRVVVCMKGAR
ncbi:MAG TPA: TIGR03013 family XrtA/PEP-CTERM system glycosyltransferase [Nitrospiraceae bacterium]|nr:TIGR03013 family XrtA/PEP-CTERM system glycosyltransferase [Nitrospiraceae bacterium]